MSYRVWLRSKPGFFTQYDGYVDVNVATTPADEDAATEEKNHTIDPFYGAHTLQNFAIESAQCGEQKKTRISRETFSSNPPSYLKRRVG